MFKLRWIIPNPPSLPIAIAIFDSVTVSIAEVKKGTFKEIFLVRFKFISVFEGKILEYLGNNKTSSKVNASFIVSIYTYIQLLKFIKTLKFHNVNKFLLTLFG